MVDMTRHTLLTACTATAAALLLAACGSSDSDDNATGQPDDTARLAFAKCMRAAGIDFQDSSVGGKVATRIKMPKGFAPARLQKIQAECGKKTGGAPKPPSKEEQAKFLDQALKFSRCMREHGVDLPDPQASGGGGIMIQKNAGAGSDAFDPSSPAFKAAQKACASFTPGGKGGGAGPSTQVGGGAGEAAP
jgi:hypothetical protein